jgi:hypothetical protein
VGIHTPEFGFEHTHCNVADAVREFGIRYPVGQDNGFRTWRAWGNEAWPAFYLLDRDGRIVLIREGEGHAHELEAAIRALLGLAPAFIESIRICGVTRCFGRRFIRGDYRLSPGAVPSPHRS